MNGGDATKAYKKAYNTKTDNISTVYHNASKLLKSNKVSTRIHVLKMQRFGGKILSIQERKEILSSNGIQGDHKSIDVLNKMEGVYDAKDVEVDDQVVNINFNIMGANGS